MAIEYRRDVYVQENIEGRFITSIARTGKVILLDGFEQYTSAVTEKWKQAAGTIALDTAYPYMGTRCMKETTGTAAGDGANALRRMGYFTKGRQGLELYWMSMSGVANIRSVKFEIVIRDGAKLTAFMAKWLGEANKKWQYLASDNTLRDITDAAAVASAAQDLFVESTDIVWHRFKLVVDFNTARYVRLISDWNEYNLSDLSGYNPVDTQTPFAYTGCEIVNAVDAAARDLYVDNVIWTIDEP